MLHITRSHEVNLVGGALPTVVRTLHPAVDEVHPHGARVGHPAAVVWVRMRKESELSILRSSVD